MANPLNTNPTRQELLKLKKKLKRATRGHKLLEDKRDGLMKEFMGITHEVRDLRKKVEREIKITFKHFLFASALTGTDKIKPIFQTKIKELQLRLVKKNIMGVETYSFHPERNPNEEGAESKSSVADSTPLAYSLVSASYDLDLSILAFKEIFNDLLKLAELEHTAKLLAQEIEKTRRRVNALEYVLIPRTQETIKYIESKIGEQERGTIVALMALKKQMV